jgi:hypothetical protein
MGAIQSEKTMFEVYRDTAYSGRYRVVYFTELDEHNKELEINRAAAAEPFFDGYIGNFRKDEAKRIIDGLLARMNSDEAVTPDEFAAALAGLLA